MIDLHIRLKRYRRRQQGQTMVLGAVALLLMAMMMLLTLNVGSAAHERIRLQSHSDAMAYSKAVEVARAFNYFAYTNRAIAGAMVSMAAIHSWMSIASLVPEIWAAGAMAWIFVGLNEIAKICMHTWCSGLQHIAHAVKAFASISPFNSERNNKRSQLRNLDGRFRLVMQALDLQVAALRTSQLSVLGSLVYAFTAGADWGNGTNGLLNPNGKKIQEANTVVGLMGANTVKRAIDNSGLPLIGNNNSASKTRARTELAEAANGSRYASSIGGILFSDWLATRGFLEQNAAFIGVNAPLGQMRSRGKVTVQFSFVVPFGTGRTKWWDNGASRAKFTGNDNHPQRSNTQGLSVGSADPGGFFMMMTDCTEHGPSIGFWFYQLSPMWAFIRSDAQGNGKHEPSNTHQGSHQIGGSGAMNCFRDGTCFVKFNPGQSLQYPGPATRHGYLPLIKPQYHNQPVIYASSKLALRKIEENDQAHQAWELNDTGNVSINTTAGPGAVTTQLTPTGDAIAISKSMVYYHRPGEWQEGPNFWNPFWRAKLHPFVSDAAGSAEAGAVAAAAGAGAAAAITTVVAP